MEIEQRCRYRSVCLSDNGQIKEECIFYQAHQRRELELLIREQLGIITVGEREYLSKISVDVKL